MTVDATMQAVFAALFVMATSAVGWLVTKLWVGRDDAQAKVYGILEKQFDDAARRKDLFDTLGKAIDGQSQAIRDLTREVASARTDIQRGRP